MSGYEMEEYAIRLCSTRSTTNRRRILPLFACVWACLTSVILAAAPTVKGDDAPTLLVDDDKVQCPTAGFTKIQDAVNAAPAGAKIRVCPGTYNEQVRITKHLTIRGDNGAIVMPSNMSANTTSLATSAPIAAAILVADATNVRLENLTADGANNNIGGCAPTLVGIFYRNASGEISDVAVRNMKLSAALNGCQSGLGIFVQSGGGGTSHVEIEGSSVHDFQKNGITGNETGTRVEISHNVVTGIGPTSGAAQNGIQIGFGAHGAIRANQVANHIWSPCVSVAVCAFNATNILVFQSNDVRVNRNAGGVSQLGIALAGDHNEVDNNIVLDTLVLDGIAVMGNANEVHANSITHSDESGIFIDGNNNDVTANRINEAPIGILKTSGSLGNVVSGNHFFNTPIQVKDPPPANPGNLSPYR